MGTAGALIDVVLAGVLVPILVGLGQIWKGLGVKPEVVPIINVVVGEILTLGYTALTKWPLVTGQEWSTAVITGLVVGLAASHLYDAGKAITSSRP